MKYYHKYKDSLEAGGYRVDADGYVWDTMGNQSAGEDRFGNVQSKDPNVIAICIEQDEAPLLAKLAKPTKKRARNSKGHLIADDPSTPENEAWVDE